MSTIVQVGGIDPAAFWALGALPLAFVLDISLGDVPGRSAALRGMDRLIATAEARVGRSVAHLGGGRGGDLFGGCLLAASVGGVAAAAATLAVAAGDAVGGPAALGARALVIAAGLVVRSTGDRILQAAEAPGPASAAPWLASVGGREPAGLARHGIDRVCVAAVGEETVGAIVAPLFWLAVAGPAGLWGFLALRSLRATLLGRPGRPDLKGRVPVTLADAAEAVPGVLAWNLMAAAAGIVRADAARAWQFGRLAGRSGRWVAACWGQGALAGALGVQVPGGRVFAADPAGSSSMIGGPARAAEGRDVLAAVRIMQVTALLAAGLAATAGVLR